MPCSLAEIQPRFGRITVNFHHDSWCNIQDDTDFLWNKQSGVFDITIVIHNKVTETNCFLLVNYPLSILLEGIVFIINLFYFAIFYVSCYRMRQWKMTLLKMTIIKCIHHSFLAVILLHEGGLESFKENFSQLIFSNN